MALGWLRITLAGILVGGAAYTMWTGYHHYVGLLDEVEALTAERARLEDATAVQRDTIDSLLGAVSEWESSQAELLARVDEALSAQADAAAEIRRLNDVLTSHDLGGLATERPGLVEDRIDGGTARVLRMLECASGAGGADCAD